MNDPINAEIDRNISNVTPLVNGAVDEFIAESMVKVLKCMSFKYDLGNSGREKLFTDLLQLVKSRVNEIDVEQLESMIEAVR